MAKAVAGKRKAQGPRRVPRATVRFTPSDAAVSALLILTIAGVATQAIRLTGNVRLLMIAATGLSVLCGFWRPRMWVALVGVALITAGAAAGAYALKTAATTLLWIGVGAAIVLALGLLSIWVSTRLRHVHKRMMDNRRIIDALTQIDPATGAFRPPAGRERLHEEVNRAVRYQRPFTLLVGRPRNWQMEVQRRGLETAQEVYAETLRTATMTLRQNDIVATEPEYSFFVILPETTAEGGEYAARHIQEAVQGLLEVRFGLVQCPDDGETDDGLLREAYQALAFAEMADLPLISRRSLVMED